MSRSCSTTSILLRVPNRPHKTKLSSFSLKGSIASASYLVMANRLDLLETLRRMAKTVSQVQRKMRKPRRSIKRMRMPLRVCAAGLSFLLNSSRQSVHIWSISRYKSTSIGTSRRLSPPRRADPTLKLSPTTIFSACNKI